MTEELKKEIIEVVKESITDLLQNKAININTVNVETLNANHINSSEK